MGAAGEETRDRPALPWNIDGSSLSRAPARSDMARSKLKSILLKSTLIALHSPTSTHRTHTHLGLGGHLKSYGAGSGSQFSVVVEHFALDKGSSLSLQPYTSAYASARSTSTRGRAGHQSPGHNGGTILCSGKALRECLQAGRANALLQCQCRPHRLLAH